MYEGLTEHSSFEKVQDFMWHNNRHGCPKPCPRKQVDITEFAKHPELLTYKKRVADMSIDEMTRYISGEWDGHVAKTFDQGDDDPLPTATTQPAADLETHEKKSVQDMSKEELTDLLDGDLSSWVPKAANDTEPEQAADDNAEVANVSTENDSTPLFGDIASINMSQMPEAASATEPEKAVNDAVPEATPSDAAVDAPAEPVADAPAELVADAPREEME